jgi:hypothetical protein
MPEKKIRDSNFKCTKFQFANKNVGRGYYIITHTSCKKKKSSKVEQNTKIENYHEERSNIVIAPNVLK